MEVLLMAIILKSLCLHQDAEDGYHIPSVSKDCYGSLLALDSNNDSSWVYVNLKEQGTRKDMAQLCYDLSCGIAFAEKSTVSMNMCLHNCTIINSTIYNCTVAKTDHSSNLTKIFCAWQIVQLIGGKDRCVGRVELFGPGGWGTVCDDGWDLRGGDIVCAQMGCGTAVSINRKAVDVNPGSGPIHISRLNCSGTEKNLWQCATELERGRNYCGHKEDAAVMCSESIYYIPVTTVNATTPPILTNMTTETRVAADNIFRISLPVLGCIFLSVTLLLLLFSNAAQCAYYRRRNGVTEIRRSSQASQQDNSEISSDSDNDRYYIPTAVNTPEHNVDMSYPEHSLPMTYIHDTNEPAKKYSESTDSDSTSSGECYENTGGNSESFLQSLKGDPPPPEQLPSYHNKPQIEENSSVSQSYSPDQDDSSTSSEEAYENITKTEEDCFARNIPSVPSTDSDYVDVSNW